MEKCIQCEKNPILIKKRKLCRSCYARNYYSSKSDKKISHWKVFHSNEIEFSKNFFNHKNWLYHPVIFRLKSGNYEPDFYDGERNTFIEVVGTKQAFHANFDKYALFIKTFPLINFEIRNSLGEIKPLTKRAYVKKQDGGQK